MRYRTKPCEIEAVQWTGKNPSEIMMFVGESNYTMHWNPHKTPIFIIHTLEGNMAASIGDYIIRGLRGEYYPCKPDVFQQKYEVIPDDKT